MSWKTIFIAVVSGTLVGAFALATAQPASSSTRPVQRLTITIALGDQVALPANFAIRPGARVVVTFRNHTHAFHTFTIRALGISVLIAPAKGDAPGITKTSFEIPAYGVYSWRCVLCAAGAHSRMHEMSGKIYAIVTGP